MLNWVLEGMEIYKGKEEDMQERKRGSRNRERGKRSESDVWPNEERWLGTSRVGKKRMKKLHKPTSSDSSPFSVRLSVAFFFLPRSHPALY